MKIGCKKDHRNAKSWGFSLEAKQRSSNLALSPSVTSPIPVGEGASHPETFLAHFQCQGIVEERTKCLAPGVIKHLGTSSSCEGHGSVCNACLPYLNLLGSFPALYNDVTAHAYTYNTKGEEEEHQKCKVIFRFIVSSRPAWTSRELVKSKNCI